MKPSIDLAISPCPNDTYIFGHLVRSGLPDRAIELHLADVEELNRRALFEQRHAITKLSFFAILAARETYELLDAGGALGYGCGPLLVGNQEKADLAPERRLEATRRIYVPGSHTTAHLLVHLFLDDLGIDRNKIEFVQTRYDQIVPKTREDDESLGTIIHEERFTFQDKGLHALQDLGAWWESVTALPIPLGGIAIRKDQVGLKQEITEAIRDSIQDAQRDEKAIADFIRSNARELDDAVIRAHIDLYVNRFSLDLGEEGKRAIEELTARARSCALL